MKEIISDAARFTLEAFKLKQASIPSVSRENQDIFLGTVSGLIEAMGDIIREEEPELYQRIINALEKVALK